MLGRRRTSRGARATRPSGREDAAEDHQHPLAELERAAAGPEAAHAVGQALQALGLGVGVGRGRAGGGPPPRMTSSDAVTGVVGHVSCSSRWSRRKLGRGRRGTMPTGGGEHVVGELVGDRRPTGATSRRASTTAMALMAVPRTAAGRRWLSIASAGGRRGQRRRRRGEARRARPERRRGARGRRRRSWRVGSAAAGADGEGWRGDHLGGAVGERQADDVGLLEQVHQGLRRGVERDAREALARAAGRWG